MSDGTTARRLTIVAAVTAATTIALPAPAQSPAWRPADSAYTWSFPRDHWSHPAYKTEWWYVTGHLSSVASAMPRFGYQFTFFRIGLLSDPPVLASSWTARDLIMGHLALTDLETGRHVFSELLYRATPLLGGFGTFPDTVVAWSRGPAGTSTPWRLLWNGEAFTIEAQDARQGIALSLRTRPAKPLVYQGPNGYSRKGTGAEAASQYYSFTRLDTQGTVIVGGDTVPVAGRSWMDKEFGSNQLTEGQTGWDWFSLQLDDGRELMLYLLRSRDGRADYARGTLVSAAGRATYLAAGDWTVTVRDRWRSRVTGADYPSRWRISVPQANLDLAVEPLLASQENVSGLVPGLAYWEGAVLLRTPDGRVVGRGYVELTGYAEDGRLPI